MSIVDRRRTGAVRVVLALVVTMWPSSVCAEHARFVRLGGGVVSPQESRVDATTFFPDGKTSRPIDFGAGVHATLTAGVWFQPENWVGAAVDVSYQRYDGDGVRFDHIGTSILVMVRRALADGVDGHVAVGPLGVLTIADIDFQPDLTRAFDGIGTAFGVDARAGVTRSMSERAFVDCEYRFVHHDVDIETETAEYLLGFPARPKERVRVTVDAHSISLGVGVRF